MTIEPLSPGYRIIEDKRTTIFEAELLEDAGLVLRFLTGASLSEQQRLSAIAAIRMYDAEVRRKRERQAAAMAVPDPVPEVET